MPLYHPSSMASTTSHHQFYSNYTFTDTDHHLSEFPTSGLASFNGNNGYSTSVINMDNNNTMLWGSVQDPSFIPNVLIDNGALDHVVPLLDYDTSTTSSSPWMPNFCDQLGGVSVSDLAIPSNVSDCKMGFYGGGDISAGFQNFSSRSYQPHHIGEFGEECCGFVEDVKPPAYPNTATENWGIQVNPMATVEEPNIKVGRYSEEERKERILRYLKKRNQRNFNKTIKYACRKTLADRRVRVRGRFARNNDICEEDMATKKHDIHHQKDDFSGGDSFQFQLKNDEEDWLQEAMASLVYLSNSSPEDM